MKRATAKSAALAARDAAGLASDPSRDRWLAEAERDELEA
jgi:hypothetical protein